MQGRKFSKGQWVIYRKLKHTTSPGPRAQNVAPAHRGETYTYVVEKFWIIEQVEADGRLRLRTRRGKQHVVTPENPQLRLANWWERVRFRQRFRAVEQELANAGDAES